MKKLFTLTCLLSVICLYAQAQKEHEQTTVIQNVNGPQFEFYNRDSIYDFGGLPVNTAAVYELEFKNNGSAPLQITNIRSTIGNAKIKWPGKPVKPGKKGMITVTYTADDNVGSFAADIFINSNATAKDYPLLHISGAVVPENAEIPARTQPAKSHRAAMSVHSEEKSNE